LNDPCNVGVLGIQGNERGKEKSGEEGFHGWSFLVLAWLRNVSAKMAIFQVAFNPNAAIGISPLATAIAVSGHRDSREGSI
jgi:hypothetical protein